MDLRNPVINPIEAQDDEGYELSLRPKSLGEYIGQSKIKENLSIYISAAKGQKRGTRPCPAVRSTRFGENDPGPYHCQGNGR